MRCVREHQEQEQQPDCAEKCGEEGRGAEKVANVVLGTWYTCRKGEAGPNGGVSGH